MGNRILFVEDEPHKHEELREGLIDMGYHLDLTPNTLDAFSVLIYDKNRLKYDLVLLDLMMSAGFLGNEYPDWQDFGGLCLCEEILKNNIRVKLLVYSHVIDEDEERKSWMRDKGIPFVHKKESTSSDDELEDIISAVTMMLPLK